MKFATSTIVLAAVLLIAGFLVALYFRRRADSEPPPKTPYQLYCESLVPISPAPNRTFKMKFDALTHPRAPTEELIRATEGQLGVSFPEDYRAFLFEFNGVYFRDPWPRFTVPNKYVGGSSGESFLQRLESLDENFGLVWNQKGYDFHKRVPKRIVAIGDWNGHWRVCISVDGPDRGAIYFWDPGEPWGEEGETYTPTEKHLTFVSKDFRSFWNGLFLSDDELK